MTALDLLSNEVSPDHLELFSKVVCGVDGSAAGMLAAAVAARLTPPDGELALVHVARASDESLAPWRPDAGARDVDDAIGRVVERAQIAAETFHPVTAAVLYGGATTRLLEELEGRNASLAVVGAHTSSRVLGVVLGSVATRLIHAAPCSVLVVRRAAEPSHFPRVVVLGDDGSREAGHAAREARLIGDRFGAEISTLVATGGEPLELGDFSGKPGVELDPRRPVDALVRASRHADLIVVGSRGLHGTAALGSVSERVAHRAACSVLVVRST